MKNISLKKVKTSAPDQDLFDVAQGIAAVLGAPVDGIFDSVGGDLVGLMEANLISRDVQEIAVR